VCSVGGYIGEIAILRLYLGIWERQRETLGCQVISDVCPMDELTMENFVLVSACERITNYSLSCKRELCSLLWNRAATIVLMLA